jgi:hypothetical protein
VAIDRRLEAIPPFEGLRVADPRALRCVYADGSEPLLLHHYLTKPWLEPSYEGVYSRLLRRLLGSGDIAVTVPAGEIPMRLRSGLLGYADRKRINARHQIQWRIREPLAERVGRMRGART